MVPLDQEAIDTIFLKARTYSAWLDRPVPDDLLKRVYDLAKMGPTSANTSPQRIVFVRSQAGKERLKPALIAGNQLPQIPSARQSVEIGMQQFLGPDTHPVFGVRPLLGRGLAKLHQAHFAFAPSRARVRCSSCVRAISVR